MKDRDEGNSTDDTMSTWSGNAEYYLKHDLLVGNQRTRRNMLSISTKLSEGNTMNSIGKSKFTFIRLFFLLFHSEMQLSIYFRLAEAHLDVDGNACDSPVDGKPNLCDTYIVVKLDGQQVYQTKIQNNTDRPGFDDTLETGLVTEDTILTLEMWDSDVGHSSDDLMSTWSGNFSKGFYGRPYFEGNRSVWSPPNHLRVNVINILAKKPQGS